MSPPSHDSADATGIPNTCQTTRSFYGWLSRIVTWDMCFHCEHHDHPRGAVRVFDCFC